jgi:uncharacterized protein YjbI with pentapeptide repeats
VANPIHLAKLKEGVEAWNQWRKTEIRPDLSGANLSDAYLRGAVLSDADLSSARFIGANLSGAVLSKANLVGARLDGAHLVDAQLYGAYLSGANLHEAHLSGAHLNGAYLSSAYLIGADLGGANLSGADLQMAQLNGANLREAKLSKANLSRAHLSGADLSGADLSGADLGEAQLIESDLRGATLSHASLIRTNLEKANLAGCHVYGVSVWDIRVEGAIQSNLVIKPSPYDESSIQVDNLEVAQFIYLILNNKKIRNVIDTITSKVVLILGRFTDERKAVLEALRNELRKRDYLPVLFDFQKPDSKDLTGTVTTLANMARFIIADLTDPSSVPHELASIVPTTPVALQTIILKGQKEYTMLADLKKRYRWVLNPYRYDRQETLLGNLDVKVIAPAEAKAKALMPKSKRSR